MHCYQHMYIDIYTHMHVYTFIYRYLQASEIKMKNGIQICSGSNLCSCIYTYIHKGMYIYV